MKTETNFIDYGIYIDRKISFIISLNHVIHEEFIQEEIEENEAESGKSKNQDHIQNSLNENLKKFCKNIISKLENVHSILIFGPSVSKFELQKEIRNSKQFKNIKEELLVTDSMEKEAAIHYVKKHFTTATAVQ